MRHSLLTALALVVAGIATVSMPTVSVAQQKTARQCADEWRTNKADNQARGITERAYVTQCRAGTAAAQPAPTPAPTSPPPARTGTASPASPRGATTGAAPTGANQFASESQARARCGSETVVWVNEKSRVYHFSGTRSFGNTKRGAFMCERDAMAAGNRAAKTEKHP
jgi:hypothetical protein